MFPFAFFRARGAKGAHSTQNGMMGLVEIQWYHWVGFILLVLLFLAADLGLFHREAREVPLKEAILWTGFFVICALGFATLLLFFRGHQDALEFVTGYLIELSLSMDNVFVIAVIFQFFGVPRYLQHRVLFWGILGALVMRGLMIWAGTQLIARHHWIFYIFGVFLVFTGIRMFLKPEEDEVDPEQNIVIRMVRRIFPVTARFYGQSFVIRKRGRYMLTPLALALVMVETTDLIFAMDSIPAIFAITTKDFIVFTSNVFAILGLRSLYFLLAGAVTYFYYLKYGLAIVLSYVGVKMLIQDWVPIPTLVSLGVVLGIIGGAVFLSILLKPSSPTKEPPASS